MRALLWIAVFGLIFALAMAWQKGLLAGVRQERKNTLQIEAGGARDPDFAPLEEGWGVAVIGAPSGAEALPSPNGPSQGAPALPAGANHRNPSRSQNSTGSPPKGRLVQPGHPSGQSTTAEEPAEISAGNQLPHPDDSWRDLEQRTLGDYRIEVAEGQSLSRIARNHYGDEYQAKWTLLLARYNGLEDPNQLIAGETLLLPELERLLELQERD